MNNCPEDIGHNKIANDLRARVSFSQ